MDILFIGAIICGAGVGLGLSFPLISSVISKIFVIERTVTLDIFTIIICAFIFGMSAYVGVQKGIRRLSNINVIMVIIFLLIILLLGPSKYILSNSADSFVFLLKEYIPMSISTGTEISINWSVFYWAWWLALAPMIGTFIINVSNNKSLRQIIFGTIFIGSFGCIFSMMILSNLSISLFESGYINSPNIIENNLMSKEELVVKTISSLNYNYLLIAFSIILIIFLCTTYDSATYVLASASMKDSSMESSKSLRVLFAILLVVQPTLLMYLNGVDSFKWIMVIFSIPLLFIYLMLIYSILKNVYSIKIT